MLTEARKQAIFRFLTVVLAGAASAALINLDPLVVAIFPDANFRLIATIALTGVLQGLIKLLSGASVQVDPLMLAGSTRNRFVKWWGA